MSLSSKDQVDLLLSCISHSISGKIDFNAVANECNITSAGAAAKRFARLKAQRDAITKGTGNGGTQAQAEEQGSSAAGPAKGKRKRKTSATKKMDGAAPVRKRGRPAKAKAAVKEVQEQEEEEGEADHDDVKADGNVMEEAAGDAMGIAANLDEGGDEASEDDCY